MESISTELPRSAIGPARLRFYYGWVNVTVAAAAMVGTLAGRTQGLGLITEPLLADLQIDRVLFAQINLCRRNRGARQPAVGGAQNSPAESVGSATQCFESGVGGVKFLLTFICSFCINRKQDLEKSLFRINKPQKNRRK